MNKLNSQIMALGILTLLVSLLSFTGTAGAAESPHEEARRHFYVGVKLLKVEDFQGALTEFETSLRIRQSKATLFNLANTYQALHLYHEALSTIAALRAQFADELSPQLTVHVDRIESDLLEIVAQVTVNVAPKGAKIYYRDRLVGEAPLDGPLFVGPGEHEILVSAEGHQPHELSFNVVSQEEKILDIELIALDADPHRPSSAPELSRSVRGRKLKPVVFWTAASITGALALGFLITDLTVIGRNNKIETGGQSDDYVKTTQGLQTVDRTLGIAALSGLVVTGVLAIFTDFQLKEQSQENGFSLTGAVSLANGPGVLLQGVF